MRQISLGIGAAGLFMILFVCANGTAEAIRERLPQFGVLKAIGFGDGATAKLVVLEAVIPTLLAAVLGSALALIVTLFLSRLAARGVIDMPEMRVSLPALGWALAAALLVALLSAVTPLNRLLRMNAVSLLAKR